MEPELSAPTFLVASSAGASWATESKMEKNPSTRAETEPPAQVKQAGGSLAGATWLKPALAGPSVVDCGPPASAKGVVLLAATGTTYSSVATFMCDEGFRRRRRSGDNSSVCGADGRWSPVSLWCEGKNTSNVWLFSTIATGELTQQRKQQKCARC